MTGEEIQTASLVYAALRSLQNTNRIWSKNLEVFYNMGHDRRLHWWRHAQKQAALGVPAMQELVNAVILLRLTS